MKTATYPALGSRVSFVCQGTNNELIEGSGRVLGIVLDPHKRPMVALETDEVVEGTKVRRNVHVTNLDPSDETKATFKATLEAVAALGSEGNGKAAQIVAEYNQRIDELHAPVLGTPVEFDE